MAILDGYQKVKKYIKESSGYRLLSQWVNANTVVLDDGTTLQTLASGLGDASKKGVDTGLTTTSTSTNLPTSKAVAELVSQSMSASDAMVFKGTIGTNATDVGTDLPTTGVTVGDTYKIATAGTYASVSAKIGDLFIATATTPTWAYVPAGDETVSFTQTLTSGTALGTITIDGAAKTIYGSGAATTAAAGLMSAADKVKLNGIATGATKVTSATVSGWGFKTTDNNTTYTLSQNSSDQHKLILTPSTGTATTVTTVDTTYGVATTAANGLMSSTDKTKLNGIATGATKVTSATVKNWGYVTTATLINDTTASANTVYSSKKIDEVTTSSVTFSGLTVTFTKIGHVVSLYVNGTTTAAIASEIDIATIPDGFVPITYHAARTTYWNDYVFSFQPSGYIRVLGDSIPASIDIRVFTTYAAN